MNYFDIEVANVKNQISVINNVAETVAKCSKIIENILPTMNGAGLSKVVPSLNTIKYELNIEEYECNALKETLLKIVLQYVKQEIELAGNQMSVVDILQTFGPYVGDIIEAYLDGLSDVEPYEIDSILFDENGQYGGNQMDAEAAINNDERDKLYDIIEANIPEHNFTEAELEAFLKRATSEGCGYVALTNSIFMHYENDPEGFEETFGYPMYNEDGDLNYNMLFIDLYSSVDCTSSITGFMFNYGDYDIMEDGNIFTYNPWMDENGNGTNSYDRAQYINRFMEEHSVEANYESRVDVTPENFQEISENGDTVIIRFRNGNIYDSSGRAHTINGGHAMVVTGVTGDGRYIVSSWGQEFYLDPNETECTDNEGNVLHPSWSFDTVSYE